MAKILIVEDNVQLATLLKIELAAQKHTVELVNNGTVGLETVLAYEFDLIILDVSLPGMDGLEICRRLRKTGNTTPVLMLTGRREISDRVSGLDCGADDYLTKPFDARELQARLRALLRRASSATSNTLSVGPITLDLETRDVHVNGQPVKLLPREFALLEFFMLNPNKIFRPEALIEKVWKSDKDVSLSTVYTTLKTLRDKISPSGDKETSLIANVHGAGYKLRSE